MESRKPPKRTIKGLLWLSFGLLIFIIAVAALVYYWQIQRINSGVVQVVEVQSPLERTIMEMQINASNAALAVSNYIDNRDPAYVEQAQDSETELGRAVAEFDGLANTDETRQMSQEITGLYQEFKGTPYQVITLVAQQYTAYLSFQEDANEINDLMDGTLQAILDGGSPDTIKKLESVLHMQASLDKVTTAVESYIIAPSPRLAQEVKDAQVDFKQYAEMYQETSLSAYEDNWLDYVDKQFDETANESIEIFLITDNLQGVLGHLEQSLQEIDAYLDGEARPLVHSQLVDASETVQTSAVSAGNALLILGVIGVLVGIAAVLIMYRKILKPVHGLMEGAKTVARGKFEHRFDIDAGGEFGQAAFALNQMLENLGRSREALGESEEMAWALLDSTNDAVILADRRGIILSTNEVAAERYGKSLEQMIDISIFDLLPSDSVASAKAKIAEVIRTGKPVHSEYEREGKIIDQNIYPVLDGKGEISRIAIFARDITVRKWVEEVVEQLGRRNELILEAAGEGIYGLDTQGKTTFVNPAAARMLGYKPEDLIGQRHHELVHHSRPDGKPYPPEHCPIYATFKDGTVHTGVENEVFWRKDGTCFPIEYTSTPIIEDGRILGAVVTFQDITERKRIESALRQSEETYRLMFDAAASLIISVDKEGVIIDCNKQIKQMLGYAPDEIIGQSLVEIADPGERTKVQESLNEVLTEGSAYNNQYLMIRKDGTPVAVRMNAAAARDTNGAYVRTICMIDDIPQQS